jgi:cell pole-organizing protein PopZ
MVYNENKQDMSMEDILASIRRYVSDGQNLPKDESISARKDTIPVIELTDEILPTDSVEFKQTDFIEVKKDTNLDQAVVANQKLQSNQQDYLYGRQRLVNDARPANYNDIANNPIFPNVTPTQSIKFSGTSSAYNPFEKLQNEVKSSENNVTQINLSADTLLNQMATPLVKSWLDQNLRKIVEELVEREVQKIRKGL